MLNRVVIHRDVSPISSGVRVYRVYLSRYPWCRNERHVQMEWLGFFLPVLFKVGSRVKNIPRY